MLYPGQTQVSKVTHIQTWIQLKVSYAHPHHWSALRDVNYTIYTQKQVQQLANGNRKTAQMVCYLEMPKEGNLLQQP